MSGSPLPVDSLGMWEATAGLPEQMAAAAAAAVALGDLDLPSPVADVTVLGMGGSGIAGDVLAAVAGPELAVPVAVVKGYRLPAFVGRRSLVFAVSCSGDTEETVAAASAARAAGATVVTVAGGGELARTARAERAPLIPLAGEVPQPRAALGSLAVPPMVVLDRIGLWPGAAGRVAAAVDQLSRRRDELVAPGSLAEVVARRIGRTIPLVHGSPGPAAVAAQRWKTQVNENAKSPAFWSVQPELCHNEVVGWGQGGDVTRQLLTVVLLRHPGEHPRVASRFAMVAELLEEVVAGVVEVWSEGTCDIARLFDLALVGDFVSLHLAGAEGVDPGPVPVLGELKERLRSV
ncbi:MAG: SIS domain-containing protein [Acidimicrobiales bacterium]